MAPEQFIYITVVPVPGWRARALIKKYIDKLSDLQFGPKSKIVFLVTNNSFVTNNSDGKENIAGA